MTVTERLLKDTESIWAEYHQHPFVQGIADGTLDKEKFKYYMIQDYLYLLDYTKVFAIGVAKAKDRAALETAIEAALKYDRKVLVEDFIRGQEVEVAVLGNDNPFASVCGEIDSGAEFYDYDAKYISDCAQLYIPARIPEEVSERVRDNAIRIYEAMGCRGLSRVDFFVTYEGQEIVFNEINTLPGFTSISMYPKLFEASGIPYPELLDNLIELALED